MIGAISGTPLISFECITGKAILSIFKTLLPNFAKHTGGAYFDNLSSEFWQSTDHMICDTPLSRFFQPIGHAFSGTPLSEIICQNVDDFSPNNFQEFEPHADHNLTGNFPQRLAHAADAIFSGKGHPVHASFTNQNLDENSPQNLVIPADTLLLGRDS